EARRGRRGEPAGAESGPGGGRPAGRRPGHQGAGAEVMSSFEVAEPILSSPFAEPTRHWYIREGEEPEKREGRRPAVVFPPRDEPGDDQRAQGFTGFRRYASKMATGAGKTTVMGMLAAWSILNKVNDRNDARFSDVVLVVCPNVTIRSRLRELDPRAGDASIYRTRDLVPPHLMADLVKGRVLVTNWHVFEQQSVTPGGVSAKVTRAGVVQRTVETITIGAKTTTARGRRYLTPEELERQVAANLVTVIEEDRDRQGNLRKVRVESVRYVESDTAVVDRVLGREVGGKQNILVFNDEAHHA